jgi:uncharacterized surface anchored protein
VISANKSGTDLDGARFKLYRVDNELLETLTRIGEYTTSGGGRFRIDNLNFGKYYFVQTSAPAGYKATNKAVTFTLSESSESQDVTFAED